MVDIFLLLTDYQISMFERWFNYLQIFFVLFCFVSKMLSVVELILRSLCCFQIVPVDQHFRHHDDKW